MASFKHYKVDNHSQTPILADTTDPVLGRFLENLKDNLKINIISLTDDEVVFDLIGVDTSIANALRRILLAEVGFK